MRKLSWFFISLTFCIPFTVWSQKISMGFTAGASLANMHIKLGPASITADNKAGVTAGLFADVPLSGKFSFQPALNFVQKGYNEKSAGIKDKLTLNYLELPLNFLFKLK